MAPKLPKVPAFPELTWQLDGERYSISSEDADLLLDYGENQLPRFRYEMEQYEKKVSILLEALR